MFELLNLDGFVWVFKCVKLNKGS